MLFIRSLLALVVVWGVVDRTVDLQRYADKKKDTEPRLITKLVKFIRVEIYKTKYSMYEEHEQIFYLSLNIRMEGLKVKRALILHFDII